MRTRSVALLASGQLLSSTAVAVAEPLDGPSAPAESVSKPAEDLDVEVTTEDNVTTIESSEGVATLTENSDGSVDFVNVDGEVQHFDRESLLNPPPPAEVQDSEEAGPGDAQTQQINTDWWAYLCNAAVAATTGTNAGAWRAALLLVQPFRLLPVVNAALVAGNFGAGVFLSTQY